MAEVYNNDAATSLAQPVGASDITITVASSDEFDFGGTFRIRIDNEILTVTGRTGNVWNVTRASEPCEGVQAAVGHDLNSAVYGVLTKGSLLTGFTGSVAVVTSVSVVSANGISGSVANPSSTPAITLSLGAITPSSIVTGGNISATGTLSGSNFSGSSSGSNTGDQNLSGLVPKTTTVNGHALSSNVTVTASDVGSPSGSGTSTGTNTGDQNITLTTDVSGSGTGSISATITNNAVTYAKFQQASAHTLLGNPTGSTANVSEISLGTGLSFSGAVLNSTGGGGGTSLVGIANGRLTLTSGTPVTTSEVTSATTIYWTPYNGNQIALYNGSTWDTISFSEISLALGTLTSGKNYDVFCYNNSGTATLEFSSAWTSDTARNDALALQDGVYVKSADHKRRYLGTFRTISTTATADFGGTANQTGGQRFLWNLYNRKPRWLKVIDTTNQWTYTTNSWRQANGASGNKVEYVCGIDEDSIDVLVLQIIDVNTGAFAYEGVGVDSTSSPSGLVTDVFNNGSLVDMVMQASYRGVPGIGYHFIAWIENGGSSPAGATFYGDNGDFRQSGMTATCYG